MAAFAGAVGLVVLALLDAGDTAVSVGVRIGGLGLVALLAALVLGWSLLIPVSLSLVGAVYATHLALDDPTLDAKAPLLGAGLLVTIELAYSSLEERERVSVAPGESLRRLALVTALAACALVAGAGLLAIADVARASGLALDVLGAAAAAAALFVVVLLARKAPVES